MTEISLSQLRRRGLMLVLSSPSGAGKSTISRRILAQDDAIALSVSVTTRQPRPGEVDGVHYVFASIPDFESRIAAGAMLEHAKVFENYYGTPRGPVEDSLKSGRDVMFDIDWQGNRQLTETARQDVVSIFILPPSYAELERRLRDRGQDSDDVIAKRMAKAAAEMSHWGEYDYVIVNQDLDASVAAVQAILTAERMKRSRQPDLPGFVESLCGG